MTNSIKILWFPILISLFACLSCDKISPPFTEDYVQDSTVIVKQKILLEDYTGHTCPNCPTAAKLAENMQELYGDRIIVISVHAGYFAEPSGAPFNKDLRCTTGNELDVFFGISNIGNPNGMINRELYNSSRIISPDDWLSAFSILHEQNQPSVSIKIQNTYNTDTRLLQTNINTEFLTGLSGTYNIAVYILEDSIVSPQKNNNSTIGSVPTINDYVHRNVLRGDLNGTFGDTIAIGNISSGSINVKNYSKVLNASWAEKNCFVLAYIYEANSFSIIQSEIAKVTSN